jgi:anaerobic magnesium-protoporphyrin IX monomethyl ester cyclase
MAVGSTEGVDLLIDDFSQYKRYGQAVTKIGDLSPQDLIELQNEGFVSIYSAYWRWLPVLRKSGIVGLVLTFYRLVKLMVSQSRRRRQSGALHPSLE